jgi:hypothetical protein
VQYAYKVFGGNEMLNQTGDLDNWKKSLAVKSARVVECSQWIPTYEALRLGRIDRILKYRKLYYKLRFLVTSNRIPYRVLWLYPVERGSDDSSSFFFQELLWEGLLQQDGFIRIPKSQPRIPKGANSAAPAFPKPLRIQMRRRKIRMRSRVVSFAVDPSTSIGKIGP